MCDCFRPQINRCAVSQWYRASIITNGFALSAIYLDAFQQIDAQLNSWIFNDTVTHQFFASALLNA